MTKKKASKRGRVYMRGGVWWMDFSRRGRRFRQAAETARTENEAWDLLEKARDEVRQGRRPDIERTKFEHLTERLRLHYEAQGCRPR